MSTYYTNYGIAEIVHEAIRVQQRLLGEEVSPEWRDAPEWMKESVYRGVEGVLAGNGPRESHEAWMRDRLDAGWVLGDVKDVANKVSPCLVPYDDLPEPQVIKDRVFVAVVNAVCPPRPEVQHVPFNRGVRIGWGDVEHCGALCEYFPGTSAMLVPGAFEENTHIYYQLCQCERPAHASGTHYEGAFFWNDGDPGVVKR